MTGQRFAMMELKVVLANYLRRFRFSLSDPSKTVQTTYNIVLKPKDGVHLIISKRQNLDVLATNRWSVQHWREDILLQKKLKYPDTPISIKKISDRPFPLKNSNIYPNAKKYAYLYPRRQIVTRCLLFFLLRINIFIDDDVIIILGKYLQWKSKNFN